MKINTVNAAKIDITAVIFDIYHQYHHYSPTNLYGYLQFPKEIDNFIFHHQNSQIKLIFDKKVVILLFSLVFDENLNKFDVFSK